MGAARVDELFRMRGVARCFHVICARCLLHVGDAGLRRALTVVVYFFTRCPSTPPPPSAAIMLRADIDGADAAEQHNGDDKSRKNLAFYRTGAVRKEALGAGENKKVQRLLRQAAKVHETNGELYLNGNNLGALSEASWRLLAQAIERSTGTTEQQQPQQDHV